MARSRSTLAAAVAALLAVSGVALAVTRHDGDDRDRPGANASRFLELTGGSAPAPAADGREEEPGPAPAAASEDEDEDAPAAPEGMPNGWSIRPAGRRIEVLRFPLGLAATADGSRVVVSSDSGGVQGLTVIDAASLNAVPATAANLFLGLAVKGNRVYASGGNANRVFRYQLVGPAAVGEDPVGAQPFPVHAKGGDVVAALPGNGIPVPGYPGGSLLDGDRLYVAGTLSEKPPAGVTCPGGQPACSRVTVIDTTTDAVAGQAWVGLDAYGLALRRAPGAPDRLFVSNWADEAGRGEGNGTVSVVDPTTLREIATVAVGHHPSALALSRDGSRLFVANTNDDTISVVDVREPDRPRVERVQNVGIPGARVGAHPVAFARSSDGARLYVALAGLNAVEVLDGGDARPIAARRTYIPTDWYPAALAVTKGVSGDRLWVANAKGTGPGPGANGSVFFDGSRSGGTVTVVDVPADAKSRAAKLRRWTAQVRRNDRLDEAVDPCRPKGVRVSQVLCPPKGTASPVKHVVYLVTENKTFDQYFGDINQTSTRFAGRYDADPTWTLYGQQFTPNHHALADRFSLGDNFFSDAEVSVTGHSWTSGAIATDHNERTWHADYDEGIRGSHGGGDPHRPGAEGAIAAGDDELQDPEGGYIFEAFRRAGAVPPSQAGPGKLSMGIYGERVARESGASLDAYLAPGWKDGDIHYFDTCRAQLFIHGTREPGPTGLPSGESLGLPSVPLVGSPRLQDCSYPEAPAFPAEFTLDHWTKVWNETHVDVMPNFIYMSLPVNHTLGSNLGSPTPASMVADNDYAIGLITEALSKSPFWSSTVIMQTEDDTQVAADHVSSLRDYLAVSGPWAQPGPNHQRGSMPALLRTIEQLFGVEPVSLYDSRAVPMHEAFRASLRDTPDTAPYTAIKPDVPFALNGPGAPGQAASMAMDWSTYDRIDEATLNAILYSIMRGWPLRLPAYADNGLRVR